MDIFCDKGTIKRKKPTLVKDDLNMIVPRLVNFHNIRSAFLLTSFGAEDEARTRDPNLGKVVLYQLSYFRISNVFVSFGIAKVRKKSLLPNFFQKNEEKMQKSSKNAQKSQNSPILESKKSTDSSVDA